MKAIVALQNSNNMPLVIASSGMLGRCPSSWGQPDTPTSEDLMGKVHMLEEVMSSFMGQQRKQMELLTNEVASSKLVAPKTPAFQVPILTVSDTPAKKRKIEEEQINGSQTYAGAVVTGVKPLDQQQQDSIRMIQNLMQQQKSQQRQPKNICFGTAKTSGIGDKETLLAADVDLVATGVGKDCTNEDLKEFLKNKGIDVVAVETLTKAEVLPNVRTKTFKITVKPAQYETALNPEVWPYRVAVRHYRAPRKPESTWSNQSGRSGGVVDRGGGAAAQGQQYGTHGGVAEGGAQGGVRHTPVGHHKYKKNNQQQMMSQPLPDPLQIRNLFGILGQLGSLEIPPH